VFAVTGTWTMDPSMREHQQTMLPALVEGVRRNPGFLRGYWCEDVTDGATSVTFIAFETLDQARAFREAVLANAPAQAESGVERGDLRIVRV
jgi:quinol monooxygenase YgiN